VLWFYDHTVKFKLNGSLYLDCSSRYTAFTALGIRQEVKQLVDNVFMLRF